jgi:hypothetical protein
MFEDIDIELDGVTKKIMASSIMPLIGRIERIITVQDLFQCMQDGKPPLASIAMAYGLMLRSAGFLISDQQVYSDMFSGESGAIESAASSVTNLLMLMIPPSARNKSESEAPKTTAGKKKASSKSAT